MSCTKICLIAVCVMTVLSGLTATSAAAFHPLFLTQSGKELLETGEAGLGVFRALQLGVLATVECHKVSAHGWVDNKSTLAHSVKISFSTHCLTTIGGTTFACSEPIVLKEVLIELGLIGGKKIVGALLAPSKGAEFVKLICGSNETTVAGSVVAEIPELNRKLVNQYNKQLTEGEGIFAAEKSENQKYTSIELLGISMTGDELKVEGFFGGKASIECNEIDKSPGWLEICTRASC